MSLLQISPAVLEAVITKALAGSHNLYPLVQETSSKAEQFNVNSIGLSVQEEFYSGVGAIDPTTRYVLSGWAKSIEEDKPSVSEATANGELDFWQNYDAARDQFVTRTLDRILPLENRVGAYNTSKPAHEVYENVIQSATFYSQNEQHSNPITKARALLFTTDTSGNITETNAYLLYRKLLSAFVDAQLKLENIDGHENDAERKASENTLKKALIDLNVKGRRAEFEMAETLINNYEATLNREDERSALIEKYEASLLDSIAEPGRKYPQTRVTNPTLLDQDLKSGSWLQVSQLVHDLPDDVITAAAEIAEQNVPDFKKACEGLYKVHASYQILNIHRNWLDWDFFAADYWDHPLILSDRKGGGDMPALADGLILLPEFNVTRAITAVDVMDTTKKVKSRKSKNQVASNLPAIAQRSMSMKSAQAPKKHESDFEQMARKKGLIVKDINETTEVAATEEHSNISLISGALRSASVTPAPINLRREYSVASRPILQASPSPAPNLSQHIANAAVEAANPQSRASGIGKLIRLFIMFLPNILKAFAGGLGRIFKHKRTANIIYSLDLLEHDLVGACEIKLIPHTIKSKPQKPFIIKAVSKPDVTGLFRKKLKFGSYTIQVFYQSILLHSQDIEVLRKKRFQKTITVTQTEVSIINNHGGTGQTDPRMLPIFGYRSRPLPACPSNYATSNPA